MPKLRMILATGVLVVVGGPESVAHHSFGPFYDRGRTAEVEGEITAVFWQNPHIRFKINVVDAAGRAREWDLETNSVSVVSRWGLTPDLIKVGDRVRVAGDMGKRADNALWLNNMLLPSGEEVLFGGGSPRWSRRTIGEDQRAQVATDPTGALGLFRVWTSAGRLWNDDYPLTESARALRAAWDPIEDAPTANCAPKGMVSIMEAPYPIEFIDNGDEILLRAEEYDLVRTILMSTQAGAAGADQPPSLLGRSVGHWEGDTLVVETSGISYPHFDKTGIPQTQNVRYVERFTVSRDGSRLDYTATAIDPAIFTEPVVLTKQWVWRPGEVIRPYDCSVAGTD